MDFIGQTTDNVISEETTQLFFPLSHKMTFLLCKKQGFNSGRFGVSKIRLEIPLRTYKTKSIELFTVHPTFTR